MTYTVQEAQRDFARLLQEAEAGNDIVIVRDGKPVVRLAAIETLAAQDKKRALGKYAGLCDYSDDVFKPLETDEELREYGFDVLSGAKVIDESAA